MTYCVLKLTILLQCLKIIHSDVHHFAKSISKPSRTLDPPDKPGYDYNPPQSDEGYIYNKPSTTEPPLNDYPEDGYSYHRPKGSKHLFFYGPPEFTTKPPILFDPIYPIDSSYLPPYYPPQNDPVYPIYIPPQPTPPPIQFDPPPVQFDPPTDSYLPPPQYLPPVQNDPPQFIPPLDDSDVITVEVPDQIIPPNDYLPPSNGYLPPNHKSGPRTRSNLKIQIFNMSCMNTPKTKYFKTIMRMSKSLSSNPIVQNEFLDENHQCISPYGKSNSVFYMNMFGSEHMKKCGIRECGNDGQKYLCMSMRLPTIRGLKLPEDVLLTLQCRTSDKFITQVKYLSMNSPQEVQGRSIKSATVSGGKQIKFTGNAVLLRRDPYSVKSDFTIPVLPDTPVLLGEELLLRTQIKESDGWKYSRIGRVTMQTVNEFAEPDDPTDTLVESHQDFAPLIPSTSTQLVKKKKHRKSDPKKKHFVEILTDGGCRNIQLSGILPANQLQDIENPLISDLPLRAFAFEGLKPGEQMAVTIHMLACVEEEDCETKCEGDVSKRVRHRKKRSSIDDNLVEKKSNTTTKMVKRDYQTELKFTLMMPKEEGAMPMLKYEYTRYPAPNALVRSIPHILIVFILVVFMMMFVLFSKARRG